jgi:hypothetical protein
MDPITKADMYFDYQIGRMVEEQAKTNELLQQILDTLKPPVKEVEQVDIKRNVSDDKRKRR